MSRSLSRWSWAAAAAVTLLVGMPALTAQPLPQDAGAPGAWQKIRKLRTTASLLHTTAHPDDEHGGMLALVSRGEGARTTLLTLNRGEAGDNAIGPELFDALGLIRTEELRVAGRYYGLDEQYFSTAADYGFSKRVDEALDKWGREAVLADMVRVIRQERPLVIVSRFQGTARDGHGQHQAAGLLTQEAFRAAADPKRFPEQLAAEGLRPWQALKLYIGGARADEAWTVEIDPGRYEPALGESYQTFARLGLSFQRSQTGGRFVPQRGSTPAYYTRVASLVDAPAKETSFFDGIDTTYTGLPRMLRRPVSAAGTDGRSGDKPAADASLETALASIDRAVGEAINAFTLSAPSAAAPALAHGLQATRAALLKASGDPDLAQVLRVKERQFQDAINAALGVDLAGMAVPAGTKEPEGPWASFGPQPTMGPVVAAQPFAVRASFTVRSAVAITLRGVDLQAPVGWVVKAANPGLPSKPQENRPVVQRFEVIAGADAAPTRPAFTRASIAETHYTIATPADRHRPSTPPPVLVKVQYEIEGVTVEAIEPVKRREDHAPYGYALRDLDVLPAVTLTMTPDRIVVPTTGAGAGAARKVLELSVDVTNNKALPVQGGLSLTAPKEWRTEPAVQPFTLEPGERTRLSFRVTTPAIKAGVFSVSATAAVTDKKYTEGYEVIAHRDLDTRFQYRTAATTINAIDVAIAPNLKVGYVMGIGDELPAALTQLGASVTLLDERALARGTLIGFDAIVLGTRAYAVRQDLRTHNRRLLDYARQGGNLIVLYNTSEFDPGVYAPFPAKLTPDAEEVSEEDATVTVLAPQDPLFTRPNRITAKDFDGWVEQRGSKFWSEWDNAYTALLECHDRDQPAQRGGWLHARVGKGHYSYVAYAFHRQLPYGVPGAYRLMANLLSQGNQ